MRMARWRVRLEQNHLGVLVYDCCFAICSTCLRERRLSLRGHECVPMSATPVQSPPPTSHLPPASGPPRRPSVPYRSGVSATLLLAQPVSEFRVPDGHPGSRDRGLFAIAPASPPPVRLICPAVMAMTSSPPRRSVRSVVLSLQLSKATEITEECGGLLIDTVVSWTWTRAVIQYAHIMPLLCPNTVCPTHPNRNSRAPVPVPLPVPVPVIPDQSHPCPPTSSPARTVVSASR
jgi:hypothetical protein